MRILTFKNTSMRHFPFYFTCNLQAQDNKTTLNKAQNLNNYSMKSEKSTSTNCK
jgi:hypothetical protein